MQGKPGGTMLAGSPSPRPGLAVRQQPGASVASGGPGGVRPLDGSDSRWWPGWGLQSHSGHHSVPSETLHIHKTYTR